MRQLVVLKLWQAADAGDPDFLMEKFEDANAFDWDDLRQLVRRTLAIEPAEIIAACLAGFEFLAEFSQDEARLAADPYQRDKALWTNLRDGPPVTRS